MPRCIAKFLNVRTTKYYVWYILINYLYYLVNNIYHNFYYFNSLFDGHTPKFSPENPRNNEILINWRRLSGYSPHGLLVHILLKICFLIDF